LKRASSQFSCLEKLFFKVLLCAGTRYLFVGRLYERRPSYHLLGVLLFVQLGISAGTWALSNLASSLSQADVQRSNPDMPASTAKALKAAIVLQVLTHATLQPYPSTKLRAL
jgi:peroxin-10